MSIAKDFHRCLRNLRRFTDGQVKVVEWTVDTLSTLVIDVTPNDGLYEGGDFRFVIAVEAGEPKVTCLTNIYHPNIDPETDEENVCLNIEEWPPSYGLQDVIQGILFILHNPNLEDPLSPYFGESYDRDKFPDNARRSVLGEKIDGITFDDTLTRLAATYAVTSAEPQPDYRTQQDTFGLEKIFADPKQDNPLDQENAFAEQEYVVSLEKLFAEQKEDDVIDQEKICAEQKDDVIDQEKICAEQKQGDTVSQDDISVDGKTVDDVEQMQDAAEGKPSVEESVDMIVIPSTRVTDYRPHAKVCKHSSQTVLPALRRLFKLLGVAVTGVRYWIFRVPRSL